MNKGVLLSGAMALCILLLSCSKPGQQQNQPPEINGPTPKKIYYFIRKSKDRGATSLKADLGDTKDVQLVEGEIKGQIVQESGSPQEKTREGKYIYNFFVTNGKDIEMIDANGMYNSVGSHIVLLTANLEKPGINDMEFLQTGMASSANIAAGLRLPSGGTMFRIVFKTQKQAPVPMRLMGEFRADQNNKGQLIPVLEVNTEQGVLSIPVDQLIPFRKKTEQPTPAK